MPTSPSVQNYHIGKGVVSFQEEGGSAFVDLGNAPSFIWEPTIEKLEHFSSREGVKTKDFTAVTQTGATVTVTLDEITPENVALFVLGDAGSDTASGGISIPAFTNAEKIGDLKMVGTNDIGQHVSWVGRVSFIPSGSINLITDADEWTTLELQAEVIKDDEGNFGVFTFAAESTVMGGMSQATEEEQARKRGDHYG